jgi:hypothetical protein
MSRQLNPSLPFDLSINQMPLPAALRLPCTCTLALDCPSPLPGTHTHAPTHPRTTSTHPRIHARTPCRGNTRHRITIPPSTACVPTVGNARQTLNPTICRPPAEHVPWYLSAGPVFRPRPRAQIPTSPPLPLSLPRFPASWPDVRLLEQLPCFDSFLPSNMPPMAPTTTDTRYPLHSSSPSSMSQIH